MKKCSKCKTDKEYSFFYGQKRTSDGLDSWCKECVKLHRNKPEIKAKIKAREQTDKVKQHKASYRKDSRYIESVRKSHLKRKYNLTVDQYNELLVSQNNCCAICKKHKDTFNQALHVDHCHKTSKVRGLLCHKCNRAVGLIQDSYEVAISMSNYLLV